MSSALTPILNRVPPIIIDVAYDTYKEALSSGLTEKTAYSKSLKQFSRLLLDHLKLEHRLDDNFTDLLDSDSSD